MSIEIKDDTQVLMVFSLGDDSTHDIMGVVQVDGDTVSAVYRFRYYNSNNPFDETDRKSWQGCEAKDSPENRQKLIEVFKTMLAGLVVLGFGSNPDILYPTGVGFRGFQEVCEGKRWFNYRYERNP